MVWTIAPAVSGNDRRRVVVLHSLGLLLGALAVGLALVLVGSALALTGLTELSVTRALLAAVFLAWGIRVVSRYGLPYPRSRWQVPEQWRALLPLQATVAVYGVLLGVGFLTDVVLPAYWGLVAMSLVLAADISVVVLAWTAYAVARIVVTRLGIGSYDRTCSRTGEPSTAIRPERERDALTIATIVLLVILSGGIVAPMLAG